jgi:hypothetical protein
LGTNAQLFVKVSNGFQEAGPHENAVGIAASEEIFASNRALAHAGGADGRHALRIQRSAGGNLQGWVLHKKGMDGGKCIRRVPAIIVGKSDQLGFGSSNTNIAGSGKTALAANMANGKIGAECFDQGNQSVILVLVNENDLELAKILLLQRHEETLEVRIAIDGANNQAEHANTSWEGDGWFVLGRDQT